MERDGTATWNGDPMDQDLAVELDATELEEWLDALRGLIVAEGPERAAALMRRLTGEASALGVSVPNICETPYRNTIARNERPPYPGDLALERRLLAYVRWNAMAMVVRANRLSSEIGGHIASFTSAATLYDVGFNHFFRAPRDGFGGDLVFFQGHSAPGFYARAFLEGRLDEVRLAHFRQEIGGKGISSYPHPWLMPEFWQFPTVSMGLGPIQSIYQARFLKYLHARGLADTAERKVWAFLGDGEMDEPESLGAIGVPVREGLDNLIWVINCNLQRLDGPVRGNGKIVQELERHFRGTGWNVIKVLWNDAWEELFARDASGALGRLAAETLDGDFQSLHAGGPAAWRNRFFGAHPDTAALVAGWSDDDFRRLEFGGHSHEQVYAAYARAVATTGVPTVILAKTVKGYGMGDAGEARNIAHQAKKLDLDDIRAFRDRFEIPIPDDRLEEIPFYRPPDDAPEMRYLRERIAERGSLPQRRRRSSVTLSAPPLDAFASLLTSSDDRSFSTTMAFVRMLSALLRDKTLGPRVVPIVPDESRTFGMEGLFRQIGIYSPTGQRYRPQDADQLAWYREDRRGQILQEGINEAGAICSWIAAGTSYSVSDLPMIPFYIFYSMFGFQRVGDLAWAAGDQRTRGFLIGGTSGRTTLAGEGLQHDDGHSHVIASCIPNCVPYDPTYAYELAVIVRDGLRRMLEAQDDIYYYITVMNENYPHPAMPEGAEDGILRGLYLLRAAERPTKKAPRVQLLGSGAILREVEAAAAMLRDDFGVAADVWSATSFTLLQRDGTETERWNRLHPDEPPRTCYVARCLEGHPGPVVAASDYVRAFTEQIRPFVGRRYVTLGTDGFGRSDRREPLRRFFEVDRRHVALVAVSALADDGLLERAAVRQAIARYEIDPDAPFPPTV
jgi:pyruvate dehydrogenase E1 component